VSGESASGSTGGELSPIRKAFLAVERLQARVKELEGARREPIAVVGIGCRFPGGASTPEAYADLLMEGVDAVVPRPPVSRPGWSEFRDAGSLPPAGYLAEDPSAFDPLFFGIAPREAATIDPQQRLVLECAWEALEHAAIDPRGLEGSRTGVFVGVAASDWANLQLRGAPDAEVLQSHFAAGVGHSMVSGRLSYVLGLQGPSMSMDTACSSSLVALHTACQSLRSSECDLALAGGVNLILAPDFTVAFQQSQMLAADGRCRTFDADASGFSRGEGCGIVVLRRLSDAVRSGDRILAVIRGSSVNQDGPSSGLTAPNGPAQEAVIRSALEAAGVAAAGVGYVEAHGTGTVLGDPIEVQALGSAYGKGRASDSPLLVGSVKTNLGHLEAAAGIAGFIKLVISLDARTLPAHLHFRAPNPHIPWDRIPIEVVAERRPFPVTDGVRRGGLSSFGFSGTNVHVIVEEAPEATVARGSLSTRSVEVLPLSAASPEALRAGASSIHDLLGEGNVPLADIAHTAGVGRAALEERLVVVTPDGTSAREAIHEWLEGQPCPDIVAGRALPDTPGLAFLYTGQGAQRSGMGRELYDAEPAFRDSLDRAAEVLAGELDRPFLPLLFGDDGNADMIHRTAIAQPALVAVELALSALWRSWGIHPSRVMGHSVGEYAAAVDAGVMSFEDGLRLIAARGRLMQALPAGGAMAALFTGPAALIEPLESLGGAVSLAAVNAPDSSVVSGDAEAVDALVDGMSALGIQHRRLSVSHAFHSRRMEPMLEEFLQVVSRVRLSAPRVPLISNVTGRPLTAAEATDPNYWCRHIRQPVLFADGIRALVDGGIGVFLECGPDGTLSGMAARGLRDGEARCIPSLRSGRGEERGLAEATAALFAAGHNPDWAARNAGRPARRTTLPRTTFRRSSFWFPTAHRLLPATPPGPTWGATVHPLLGTGMRLADGAWVFHRPLWSGSIPYVPDHRVRGEVVVPATVHVEFLLSAAAAGPGITDAGLDDLTILEPLVLDEDDPRSLQIRLEPANGGGWSATIHSLGEGENTFRLHARGVLVPADTGSGSGVAPGPLGELPGLDPAELAGGWTGASHVDAGAFYEGLERRGLGFGPAFQGVSEVWTRQGAALGRLTPPETLVEENGRIHPALLDAGIQVLSAAVPAAAGGALYLPLGIRRLRVHAGAGPVRMSRVTVLPGDPRAADPGRTLTGNVVVFDGEGRPAMSVDGIELARVQLPGTGDAAGWVHGVAWEAAPPGSGSGRVDATTLVAAADRAVARLGEEFGVEVYGDLLEALESLSVEFIVRALAELGWNPGAGETTTVAGLMTRCGIEARHERLSLRLLRILEGAGLLVEPSGEQGIWRVVAPFGTPDPGARAEALVKRFHPNDAELQVTARCGAGLADVLTGRRDPLELLFPGGDTSAQGRIYRETPLARTLNGAIRDVIGELVRSRPAGRPLRVLEIGAGTGGTTAHVLEVLDGVDASYTFTDIGRLFVNRARDTFAGRSSMQFSVLDIDRDPLEQGFEPDSFDLVLASNVLHATRGLERTLGRVRTLLAPGGTLCMLEVTRARGWVDLTVGLIEGWWLYEDVELRKENPVLHREAWLALLERVGFEAVGASRAESPESGLEGQAILLAREPENVEEEEPRSWAVLPDDGGAGQAFAERVIREGGVAHVVTGAGAIPAVTDLASFLALDGGGGGSEEERLEGILGGTLHLVQSLLRTDGTPPRLHLVTRGAQAAGGDVESLDPVQASLWGFGRALAAEHPELEFRILDLDPAVTEWSDGSHQALLDRDVRERESALRGGERRVPRLVPVPVPPPPATPHRLFLGTGGTLDELEFRPTPRRDPGPGEIEIEIQAAGLNFRDVVHALGVRSDVQALGTECVGRVVCTGPGVTALSEGDLVLAAAGAFGHFVTIQADLAVRIPASVSVTEAATLPIAFLTADRALNVAGMRRGQRILVHAGAGGVGMAAVQLAVAQGLEVYATAGTPAKRDAVRALGALGVFDSRTLGFADDLREATGGSGVDIIVNSLAGDFIPASLRTLAPGGILVELGKTGEWDQERARALDGIHPDVRYVPVDLSDDLLHHPGVIGAALSRVVDRVAAGELKPLPVRTFPLSRAEEAFRHMAAGRHTGKLVLVADGTPAVRSDGTYLITGGLSGLGLRVAEWLAQRGVRSLVLAGRRAPSPAAEATLDAIRQGGTAVEILQVDVSAAGSLGRALAGLEGLPPIRGVVHSAGTLRDGVLVQQNWEDFLEVLRPKALGIREVESATAGHPLDFFVIFSSMASFLGSPGQANHSAANAFMDALAVDRVARGLPAFSVAWGAWGEIGAAVRHGVNERAARRGVGTIDPELGLSLLERLTPSGYPSLMVSPMQWADFAGTGPVAPFLHRVIRRPVEGRTLARKRTATREKEVPPGRTLAQELEATPPGRRRALLRDRVRGAAVRVLGLPAGYELEDRQPLGDVGLDSLMAVELRNALGAMVGRTLPATLLFDHPSVAALTAWLGRELPGLEEKAPGPVPRTQDPASDSDDLESLLGRIEGLSEEEVERRIQRDVEADQRV